MNIHETSFTENELRILKSWAETAMFEAHYGDYNVLVSEEALLCEKILNLKPNEPIQLTRLELRVLNIWASNNLIGGHPSLSEEKAVLDKIKALMKNTET